ncbi:MAG: DUF4244 domain-containing protein [Actinomycetota bacterium]
MSSEIMSTNRSPSSGPWRGRSPAGLVIRCTAGEEGQATAEYALVMLAAAALAGGVLAWVVGSDAVARLMDAVLDSIIGDVSG